MLHHFDVVAVQELLVCTTALQEVVRWLNRDHAARWRLVVSDVAEGVGGNPERLGNLLESSRFDLDGLRS